MIADSIKQIKKNTYKKQSDFVYDSFTKSDPLFNSDLPYFVMISGYSKVCPAGKLS